MFHVSTIWEPLKIRETLPSFFAFCKKIIIIINRSFIAIYPFIYFSFSSLSIYWFGSISKASIPSTKATKFSNFLCELSFVFNHKAAPTGCKAVNEVKVPNPAVLILRNHHPLRVIQPRGSRKIPGVTSQGRVMYKSHPILNT